ncbi:hypothetical protein [Salinibius halmophilus]|uniref:hypothetical protein n=1 Tax=Salinibius halmophilus TaxID=1853216 RepID=UPI000E66E0A1|nr:hypothetical protein [Salinibius halmophilus]
MEFIIGAVGFILAAIFLYLIPILWVLFSRKVSGVEKLGWVLAILFISWVAWIIFLIVAPVKKA